MVADKRLFPTEDSFREFSEPQAFPLWLPASNWLFATLHWRWPDPCFETPPSAPAFLPRSYPILHLQYWHPLWAPHRRSLRWPSSRLRPMRLSAAPPVPCSESPSRKARTRHPSPSRPLLPASD